MARASNALRKLPTEQLESPELVVVLRWGLFSLRPGKGCSPSGNRAGGASSAPGKLRLEAPSRAPTVEVLAEDSPMRWTGRQYCMLLAGCLRLGVPAQDLCN